MQINHLKARICVGFTVQVEIFIYIVDWLLNTLDMESRFWIINICIIWIIKFCI